MAADESEISPGPLGPGDVNVSGLGTQTAVTPEGVIAMRGAIPRPAGAFPSPTLPPWIPTQEQIAAQKAQEDQDFEMRKLQGQLSGLPYDQAQKATVAAMKLQGQRGYQADLAAGKPAHEALAKWAPMMFYEHPQVFAGAVRQSFTQPRPAPRWVPADPSTGAPAHFESSEGHIPYVDRPKPAAEPAKLDQLTQFDLHTKAAAVTAAQRALSAAVASGNEEAAADARKALKTASDDYTEFRKGLNKAPAPAISAPPKQAVPLPARQADLVVGQPYITKKGIFIWTGQKLRRAQ